MRSQNPSLDRAGALAFLAVLLVLLWLKLGPRFGPAATLRGCATRVSVIDHPNDHHITDTYFTVAAREMHLNSGYWVQGYKDEEGLVRQGARLEVTLKGADVVGVRRLPGPDCPGSAPNDKGPPDRSGGPSTLGQSPTATELEPLRRRSPRPSIQLGNLGPWRETLDHLLSTVGQGRAT